MSIAVSRSSSSHSFAKRAAVLHLRQPCRVRVQLVGVRALGAKVPARNRRLPDRPRSKPACHPCERRAARSRRRNTDKSIGSPRTPLSWAAGSRSFAPGFDAGSVCARLDLLNDRPAREKIFQHHQLLTCGEENEFGTFADASRRPAVAFPREHGSWDVDSAEGDTCPTPKKGRISTGQ